MFGRSLASPHPVPPHSRASLPGTAAPPSLPVTTTTATPSHLHHHHAHAAPPRQRAAAAAAAAAAMARINLPPLTRGILAALVLLTLLNFGLRPNANWVEKVEKPIIGVGNGVPWLTIVPRLSVPWYPWVFALATVVEQNLLGLITTGLTVLYGGRYLERAWGSHEFTKFMLFVAVIPNLLTYLLYVLGYLLMRKDFLMYASISSSQQTLH